jgi:hypothetical protein
LALAALCYQVFAPFLTLMVWAVTLAGRNSIRCTNTSRTRWEEKQGLAATILVLLGLAVISRADRRADEFAGRLDHQLVNDVQR